MADDLMQQQERSESCSRDKSLDPDPDLDSSEEEITFMGEEEPEEAVYELIEEHTAFLWPEDERTHNEPRLLLTQQDKTVSDASNTPVDTKLTMLQWFGTARMDQEAQGMAVAFKKEDRQKLTADALIKLQKTVTEGMTLKFSLTSHHSDN